MDREGVWELFWETGLPEAWLAVRSESETQELRDAVPCTAPPQERDGL